MKSIILATYFLIKIHYPCDDISVVRYYNSIVDNAMKTYCFADIEYDLVSDTCEVYDLDIYPEEFYFKEAMTLGTTTGKALYNPKIYGIPYIRLSALMPHEYKYYILRHEIGHFLGLDHSLDSMSLMYPHFWGENLDISRNDSIILKAIYGKY